MSSNILPDILSRVQEVGMLLSAGPVTPGLLPSRIFLSSLAAALAS